MAPGFVSAFGWKLKCVDGFVGKYRGLESQLLDNCLEVVASFIDSCVFHIVCGDVVRERGFWDLLILLMFGLDSDVLTAVDGGSGGVGVLQDGVTKTASESGV